MTISKKLIPEVIHDSQFSQENLRELKNLLIAAEERRNRDTSKLLLTDFQETNIGSDFIKHARLPRATIPNINLSHLCVSLSRNIAFIKLKRQNMVFSSERNMFM